MIQAGAEEGSGKSNRVPTPFKRSNKSQGGFVYKISRAGRTAIKKDEGEVLKVYTDPVGIRTGGVGHTGPDVDKLPVGTPITKAQSDKWFEQDIEEVEDILNQHIKIDHLPQECVDAVGSLCFNTGPGKKNVKDGFVWLKSGRHSTILTLINKSELELAAKEFPKWSSAKGKRIPGLYARRLREQALFLKGLEDDPLESNIESDCEKKPKSMLRDPGVQGLGLVGTAAALNEGASKLEGAALVSDYALYVFIALTVLGLIYALKSRNKED